MDRQTNSADERSKSRLSLIENLLVVGALLTLALLALPAWQSQTVRAKVEECLDRASIVRLQIAEHHRMFGEWPKRIRMKDLAGVMVSEHCEGFTRYEPGRGSFRVNVNEAAIADDLTRLQPLMSPEPQSSGTVRWRCSRGDTMPPDVKYLPARCQGLDTG